MPLRHRQGAKLRRVGAKLFPQAPRPSRCTSFRMERPSRPTSHGGARWRRPRRRRDGSSSIAVPMVQIRDTRHASLERLDTTLGGAALICAAFGLREQDLHLVDEGGTILPKFDQALHGIAPKSSCLGASASRVGGTPLKRPRTARSLPDTLWVRVVRAPDACPGRSGDQRGARTVRLVCRLHRPGGQGAMADAPGGGPGPSRRITDGSHIWTSSVICLGSRGLGAGVLPSGRPYPDANGYEQPKGGHSPLATPRAGKVSPKRAP